MVHIKDGLCRTISVLVVFLLLTHFCEGQLQETGPPQPVMVMVGDDTVLPCQLEPPVNAVSMTMEWGRPDLDPRFIYVWHEGRELLVDQNSAYKGRASLSINKLKVGDLSLKLSKVRFSDNGTYRCYILKLNKEYFVELLVGVVAPPGISLVGIHKVSGGVTLDCRSEGWYPKPEVLWLDSEGNLLSARPTETIRGPDGLYTVGSRVTVEKRHSNRFTCRVQQKNINQTRETHVYVSEDFFKTPSSCTASVTISILFGFMFIVTVVFLVWKWRQNKIEGKKHHEDKKEEEGGEGPREQLIPESKKEEDLKKMLKLNEELQKKVEEHKDMMQTVDILTGLKKGLEKHKQELSDQKEKTEKLVEQNKDEVKSVEKEVTEKEGDITANKAKGYLKIKEIITNINWKMEERKKEHQELQLNANKLMKTLIDEINRIKEMKKKVENEMEQIKKQTEEIETKRRGKK